MLHHCSSLSNDELENIRKNGAIIVHVTKPYYTKLPNGELANAIYWTMLENKALPWNILKKQSVLIVTTFDQVMHDK